MRVLNRYIASAITIQTIIVLFVLLAIFSFVSFMGELDRVGDGGYTTYHAFLYTLLSLPRLIYELFPFVALMGAIIGLGTLASHNELTAIRAAGVSLRQLVYSIMRVGVILVLLMIAIGEWITPWAEGHARHLIASASEKQIALKTERGFWMKDGSDVWRVGEIIADDHLQNVQLYRFDQKQRLYEMIRAERALYIRGQWTLRQVEQTFISDRGLLNENHTEIKWQSEIVPNLLQKIIVEPEKLSMWGLYRYINYLQDNGLDSRTYEFAFWRKLVSPVTTLMMVLLAVPFVFGPLRSVTIGQRILVGVLVGITFHLTNQTVGNMGLAYQFNAAIVASLPTALGTLAVLLLMRRVR